MIVVKISNEDMLERLMYNQIYPYFLTILSKFQCGFSKGFNAQHCLLEMIEKWRKTLDGGGEMRAVLTDLSKAFDCVDQFANSYTQCIWI